MKNRLQRIAKEPLLHFFIIGSLIYGAYFFFNKPDTNDQAQIIITKSEVEQLIYGFSRTWQRPPTEQELAGLINNRIREEVFYREAKLLGLDEDDTIIRRRLQQKLEFLVDDIIEKTSQPTEQELIAYFHDNPSQFQTPAEIAFVQYFFKESSAGQPAKQRAEKFLQAQRANREIPTHLRSDASLLPTELPLSNITEIKKQFGDKFTLALQNMHSAQWVGPVESDFGWHVIWIKQRKQSQMPEFNTIRQSVLHKKLIQKQDQSLQNAYDSLKAKYDIIIEYNQGELR